MLSAVVGGKTARELASVPLLKALRGHTIPEDEIDAETRRLVVEYGAGAVESAKMTVQRSQWAKGRNDSRERSARVLKAVRLLLA